MVHPSLLWSVTCPADKPAGLFFWRRSRSHTHMFQSKLSIFLGVYTIIGFLVGLITLAKSVGGPTTVSYEIGPAILAGAFWPVTLFAKIFGGG